MGSWITYRNHEIKKNFSDLVKQCDICCIDLDRCLFPTYTEVVIGVYLLVVCFYNYTLWKHIPKILSGGWYIFVKRVLYFIYGKPTNYELVEKFSSTVEGMPIKYIQWCSRILPQLSFPGWKKALGIIHEYMDINLLTFSIQPIASEYLSQYTKEHEPIFSKAKGVPVTTVLNGNKRVFAHCLPHEREFMPAEKLHILQNWMQQDNKTRPLIIGHSPDEVEMARFARQIGGISIAFNPHNNVAHEFDIVIRGLTWYSFYELFKQIK